MSVVVSCTCGYWVGVLSFIVCRAVAYALFCSCCSYLSNFWWLTPSMWQCVYQLSVNLLWIHVYILNCIHICTYDYIIYMNLCVHELYILVHRKLLLNYIHILYAGKKPHVGFKHTPLSSVRCCEEPPWLSVSEVCRWLLWTISWWWFCLALKMYYILRIGSSFVSSRWINPYVRQF